MRFYKYSPEVDINNFFNSVVDFANKFENEFNRAGKENNTHNKLGIKTDFIEFDKYYLIEAELPGINKENVNIQLEDNYILSISGKKERKTDGNTIHRQERRFGDFHRKLILPDDSNTDSIKAIFKDGVLEIKIDKKEPETPKVKEISIN